VSWVETAGFLALVLAVYTTLAVIGYAVWLRRGRR
jgi:hypothetical protein